MVILHIDSIPWSWWSELVFLRLDKSNQESATQRARRRGSDTTILPLRCWKQSKHNNHGFFLSHHTQNRYCSLLVKNHTGTFCRHMRGFLQMRWWSSPFPPCEEQHIQPTKSGGKKKEKKNSMKIYKIVKLYAWAVWRYFGILRY